MIDAGWPGSSDPEGVPQDQPRGPLAVCRMEIIREPRGRAEFTEDGAGEHIKTERLGDSERRESESRLCSGSGVFNEGDSLMSLSSQASGKWSE